MLGDYTGAQSGPRTAGTSGARGTGSRSCSRAGGRSGIREPGLRIDSIEKPSVDCVQSVTEELDIKRERA